MDKRIFKIALTGGPCSGKTTSLSTIVQTFSNDFKVYSVPEMGTIAFHSGVVLDPKTYSETDHQQFTQKLCQAQIDLERFYDELALMQGKKTLIVCDRGVVDNFAYTTKTNKKNILEETNWSYNYICNERYDLVIHLVTAAIGATDHYTLANNDARSEGLAEAIAIDKRIQKEWMGHPNFVIIDNSMPGFENKIKRVINTISSFIGVHRPKYSRRFLLQEAFNQEMIPAEIGVKIFYEDINLLFSNKENSVSFIKKRHFPNSTPNFFLIVRKFSDQVEERVETIKNITERAYFDLYHQIDPSYYALHKKIITFSLDHDNQVSNYNIELLTVDGKVLNVLKIFKDIETQEPYIPEFLSVTTEITNDPTYQLDKLTKID